MIPGASASVLRRRRRTTTTTGDTSRRTKSPTTPSQILTLINLLPRTRSSPRQAHTTPASLSDPSRPSRPCSKSPSTHRAPPGRTWPRQSPAVSQASNELVYLFTCRFTCSLKSRLICRLKSLFLNVLLCTAFFDNKKFRSTELIVVSLFYSKASILTTMITMTTPTMATATTTTPSGPTVTS